MDLRNHARSQLIDKKALTLRDFYSSRAFHSDDDGSGDSDDDSQNSPGKFDKSAKDLDGRSLLNKGQKQLYENQLRKA